MEIFRCIKYPDISNISSQCNRLWEVSHCESKHKEKGRGLGLENWWYEQITGISLVYSLLTCGLNGDMTSKKITQYIQRKIKKTGNLKYLICSLGSVDANRLSIKRSAGRGSVWSDLQLYTAVSPLPDSITSFSSSVWNQNVHHGDQTTLQKSFWKKVFARLFGLHDVHNPWCSPFKKLLERKFFSCTSYWNTGSPLFFCTFNRSLNSKYFH